MKTRGLSTIEMIVVLTILVTLLGLGYIRLTDIERRAPLSATVQTIIGELRGQQTKAMSGLGAGYGISFQTNSYTLLPVGSAVNLPSNITLTTGSISFAAGSGDASGNLIFTLTQMYTGETKTITINRYGAVTSIQ